MPVCSLPDALDASIRACKPLTPSAQRGADGRPCRHPTGRIDASTGTGRGPCVALQSNLGISLLAAPLAALGSIASLAPGRAAAPAATLHADRRSVVALAVTGFT